jgi:YHS domain-containing protein
MNPWRIVILAILGYILYKLLFAGRKKEKPPPRPAGDRQQSSTQDVLVEDPVCHTYVPQKQAIRALKDGKIHYFCSEECCQTFLADQGDKK